MTKLRKIDLSANYVAIDQMLLLLLLLLLLSKEQTFTAVFVIPQS